VAEDKGKEEEKFDFTPEGEGLLTLGDARMLAVRTAAESPGDYGSTYQGVAMVFEVVESGEDADYYTVTLSVRPQGNFDGTPGQEQFVIGKDGTIAVRQVLSTPVRKGGGFPLLPVAIGVVVVGIIAAVGAVFVMMGSGGDSVPIAATTSRAEAVFPSETPAPVVIPADTPEPTVNIDATVQAGIQQGLVERPTSVPTSVPVPTATYTPIPPTKTPTPTPTPATDFTLMTQGYPGNGGTVMGGGVYINGVSATVSATPKPGYTFGGWSGACSGTGRCVVTMNGHKTVTANFSLIPATPRPRPTSTPNAYSYYSKAVDYYSDEKYQLAINESTTSIRLNPDYASAYNIRGAAYRHLGQYQNAINDYTKAIQLDPGYVAAYNNRGISYGHLGQYQTAINDYTKAIQLDPDYRYAYYSRGNAYYSLKQYQTAIADYTKAIQLDPDDGNGYYGRGNGYYSLKQYQTAIADYTKAIQLDPDYGLAYEWRGNSYSNLGQYTLANADDAKACSLDSQFC
jgi:uncharacterized repeat protein (TIGR02543 family)